jgi:hypothetical protein
MRWQRSVSVMAKLWFGCTTKCVYFASWDKLFSLLDILLTVPGTNNPSGHWVPDDLSVAKTGAGVK